MIGMNAEGGKQSASPGSGTTTRSQVPLPAERTTPDRLQAATRMKDSPRRSELTAFLKARRAAISATSVGLPHGSRRLTAGLRREELASLAGVGLTWYTWLEQGRDIKPSAEMLRRVSRALRLSPADDAYLYSLVGTPRPLLAALSVDLSPGVTRVVHLHPAPAFVLNAVFDLLAFNERADRLYGLATPQGPFEQNQLWQFFMNPRRRSLYLDFASAAQNIVALFRLNAVHHVDDPYYLSLVSALQEQSEDFRSVWAALRAAPMTPISVALKHPELGVLKLSSVRFPVETGAGAMVVFLVPEDETTAKAFEPPLRP